MSTGCGKVDPVDPGTNVNPGGKVDPNAPKDPEKGDNIFGETIKFVVTVKGWDDNTVNINGSRPGNQ